MDANKVQTLLRWILACLVLIVASMAFQANRTEAGRQDRLEFEHWQKMLDKLLLDPDYPAISMEDRMRARKALGL